MKRAIPQQPLIFYRLIALWVVCEAMLGGIIHGFRLPISGLVVGSAAIICISLIAWYVPAKGSIIRATIIVAVFKMMLSPQAPFPAYIAVFFQGVLGELLFWHRRHFKLACMLLALLGLLESGLQRILMLTIVYGNDLWNVINQFISKLTGQKSLTNYSLFIGTGYLLLHVLAGILVGWWAAGLPQRIAVWSRNKDNLIIVQQQADTEIANKGKRTRRTKKLLFATWIILALIYLQSSIPIGDPILSAHISLRILVRSVLIILGWYFIAGPLLQSLLHAWLQKKNKSMQTETQRVFGLLPETRQLAMQSLRRSASKKGWNRWMSFARIMLVNVLTGFPEKKIVILTAPKQTGKTSRLMDWSKTVPHAFGIITPVINGKRYFMNVHSGEQFPMEATATETAVLSVGRFTFSRHYFDQAIAIIRSAPAEKGWLLIDEIGSLELRGEGFCQVLQEAKQRNGKLLLVVREGLVDEVIHYFQLPDPVIIDVSQLGALDEIN